MESIANLNKDDLLNKKTFGFASFFSSPVYGVNFKKNYEKITCKLIRKEHT